MVAGDGEHAGAGEAGDDGAGVGAVADDVAEAPDGIDGCAGVGIAEDGVECVDVAVDVGEDEDGHRANPNRRGGEPPSGRWALSS